MNRVLPIASLVALFAYLGGAAKAQTWAEVYESPAHLRAGKKKVIEQSIDISSIKKFGGKTYFNRRVCHYIVRRDGTHRLSYCNGESQNNKAEVFDCNKARYLYLNTDPKFFSQRMSNGEWWGYYEILNGKRTKPLRLRNYETLPRSENDRYIESIYRLVCG